MSKQEAAPVAKVPEDELKKMDITISDNNSSIASLFDTKEKRAKIAEMICPKAPAEIKLAFISLCRAANADPIKKEAYCWEIGGRWVYSLAVSYYERVLSSIDTFSHYAASTVYESCDFLKELIQETGEYRVEHKSNPFKDPSKPTGAYCIIYFKNNCRPPFYCDVRMIDKDKKQANWVTSPGEMIYTKAIGKAAKQVFPQEFPVTEEDYQATQLVEPQATTTEPLPPPPEPEVIEAEVQEVLHPVDQFVKEKKGGITHKDLEELFSLACGKNKMRASAVFTKITNKKDYKEIPHDVLDYTFSFLAEQLKERGYES